MSAAIGHSDAYHATTAETGATAGPASALRGLWRRVVENAARVRANARLQSLDDRALKDLGLHRTEISSILHYDHHDPSRRLR